MGWFFRRSIRIGPFLRLNLTKGGVGFSVGVPGARVSVGPTGRTMFTGGRAGVYVRKMLGRGRANVVNNSGERG